MLCELCKQKEATVYLTQIADRKSHEVGLCEDCAKEKEVNDPTNFSLATILQVLSRAAGKQIQN